MVRAVDHQVSPSEAQSGVLLFEVDLGGHAGTEMVLVIGELGGSTNLGLDLSGDQGCAPPKHVLGDVNIAEEVVADIEELVGLCLLYTSPSPRDRQKSRMPSSA